MANNPRPLTLHFNPADFRRLTFKAANNDCPPEVWIKRTLNHYINTGSLPGPESFNRLYPTTKNHPPHHPSLTSVFASVHLTWLDHLIQTLPPVYLTRGISRRRLVETLTLCSLE